MKVKELIEQLREEDQESIVMLSKDSEGTSFTQIDNVSGHSFDEDTQEIILYGKRLRTIIWPRD
jgi:hypothetical protein